MAVKFTNNASTTLAAELSSGAGSGTFTSNTGFPDISGSGDYYYVTIGTDVLKITAVSGTTWTLGSNATSTYANGSVVELRMSSEVLEDVRTETTYTAGDNITIVGNVIAAEVGATTFPFYKTNNTLDTIAITSGTFPFYKADGTTLDTIPVT